MPSLAFTAQLPASRRRPDEGLPCASPGRRTLRVYFVKPSKYDDEGTVLRFRWGVIPSNTLIVLAGLNEAYAGARPGIDLQTVIWDEIVDGVLSQSIISSIRDDAQRDRVELIVGLAGVQTNQYPRARDIALQFKKAGATVLMGGFHVTSHAPTREFLESAGVTVVMGEAESTWPAILDDYLRSRLATSYRVTNGIRARTGLADITVPRIEEAPLPAIDGRYLTRFFNPTFSTIDTSRGCPFACSYCSVKNVMGRTMRPRDPGRVITWIRDAHDRHGVRNLLLVDDDFFRSPEWEPILSGIAELRQTGRQLAFAMQADVESSAYASREPGETETQRHRRSRRFVELAARAGCYEVFLGIESFDPLNLEQTLKFQNEALQDRRRNGAQLEAATARVKAWYRRAVDNWHRAGVGVHAGYIIGLPFDGPGCGRCSARDLLEIGVDTASFFARTPLPGTEDQERDLAEGAILDHDFDHYDSTHFVASHPRLTPEELAHEYREAWRTFYSWKRLAWSVATFHRVAGLSRNSRYGMLTHQIYFTYAERRGWHPMMGGIWRIRDRTVRREAVTDEDAARLYLASLPLRPAEPTSHVSSAYAHQYRVGTSRLELP